MVYDIMPFDIHVLGLGSVGILVAHSLASLPVRPRLTVLLPRPVKGSLTPRKVVNLELVQDGLSKMQEEVEIEELSREGSPAEDHGSSIMCLIVTLKANYVAETLQRIKHRLSKDSTILFLQNGMGVTDQVDREVFPDPETRPYYLTGVNWHGTRRVKPFSAVQAMTRSLFYGPVTRILDSARCGPSSDDCDKESVLPASARYVVSKLDETRGTTTLNAHFAGPEELIVQQLWKFSCNSVFNPLTALGNCNIGTVMNCMPQLVACIAKEMSDVYVSLPWPEKIRQKIDTDYSYRRLVERLYEHSKEVSQYKTSMWQDVQNCVNTEIQYLTGYIVAVGKVVNVSCQANEIVLERIVSLQKEGRREVVSTISSGEQTQKSLMAELIPVSPVIV